MRFGRLVLVLAISLGAGACKRAEPEASGAATDPVLVAAMRELCPISQLVPPAQAQAVTAWATKWRDRGDVAATMQAAQAGDVAAKQRVFAAAEATGLQATCGLLPALLTPLRAPPTP